MAKTTQITSDQGVTFNVRRCEVGDPQFGDGKVLDGEKPTIEFYTPPKNGEEGLGYYIGNYFLSTLREIDPQNGICLQGGQPKWNLDPAALQQALATLDPPRKMLDLYRNAVPLIDPDAL